MEKIPEIEWCECKGGLQYKVRERTGATSKWVCLLSRELVTFFTLCPPQLW